MEEIKTQAIVLSATEYKESGKYLTLFSLESGIVKAKIQGVVKPKAKLAFASLPFCFGEYIVVSKTGNTVINCSAIDSFYDITKDFDRFVAGESMLEVVSIIGRENEPNPELFIMLLKALKMLAYSKSAPLAVLIKFLIFALGNAGYGLKLEGCVKCGNKKPAKEFFSFDLGARVCSTCSDESSVGLSAGEVAVLRNIDQTDIENLENLKFSSFENVVGVVKLLTKYFFHKTGEVVGAVDSYV